MINAVTRFPSRETFFVSVADFFFISVADFFFISVADLFILTVMNRTKVFRVDHPPLPSPKTVRDFRLPPPCKRGICSSALLGGVDW